MPHMMRVEDHLEKQRLSDEHVKNTFGIIKTNECHCSKRCTYTVITVETLVKDAFSSADRYGYPEKRMFR